MKSFVMSDLQRLAFDATNGISRDGYTKEQLNEAVRAAIKDACGGGDWDYFKFMENRYRVFAILTEIMPVSMKANLAGRFEEFAEMNDTAIGDKPYFVVEDTETFNLVTIARGNQDIDRNRIVDKNFSIPTLAKGIKFFDELENFISGKMDLARLTEKASTAFSAYIGQLIADTIYGSYSALGSDVKVTGAFDASALNGIVEAVKAHTGKDEIQIVGSTTALSNVVDAFGYSDAGKDTANSWGYYGEFRGNKLIALPQAFRPQTTTFGVDTNHLIILPSGEKIVKVLFEGNPIVTMQDGTSRNDMQTEIMYQRRIGAAALTAKEGHYGFYKFS